MTPVNVILFYLSATLAAAAFFSNSTNSTRHHATATIDSGVIIGTTTVLPSVTSVVNQFFGIPFAAPPTRFLPAEQPQSWNATFNATTKNHTACFQNYIYSNDTRDNLLKLVIGPTTAPTETEDCLTLDVYAPAASSNDTGKAVLFWIFGGSYRTGSNSNPNYDGASFAANQDVIFVSPNYRLNVHGFPDNPELVSPNQNLGLLDLRLALDWVRNNIATFGGDPDKITLIGQSAGAAMVDMFLSAPPDPLPFRAAILESGQASYNGGTPKSGWAWRTLEQAVDCTGEESTKYTCMQNKPATTLKKVSQSESIWFGPPVQDGVTWAKAPRENRLNSTAASSRMARVPVLIGSNRDEGSIYTTGVTNATLWLRQHYGFSLQQAAQLLAYYPIGGHITDEAGRATAVMTDSEFGCPAKFVWDDSATAAIPAWRYLFDASFANSYIDAPGAYHAAEIPLVFGTYPRGNATEFQAELSVAMQKAWADFAKDPAAGPGWNMSQVMVFGGDATPGESDDGRAVMATAAENWMDDRCALYERE